MPIGLGPTYFGLLHVHLKVTVDNQYLCSFQVRVLFLVQTAVCIFLCLLTDFE